MTRLPLGGQQYTAKVLLDALEVRHSGDVFVPECKDGPSQGCNHRRLDAWVLVKTWSPVTTIGYEIKVSRQDFLRDEKIPHYINLVHKFYVVAPKGMVDKSELPEGAGLIEALGAPDKVRLVARKHPVYREIQIPQDLLVYVLMGRVSIGPEIDPYDWKARERKWRLERLKEWVANKETGKGLCHEVSKRIREEFSAQEERLREMRMQLSEFQHIDARLQELGFDPKKRVHDWQVRQRIEELSGVSSAAKVAAERAITNLQALVAALTKAEESVRKTA